jgi:ComF family protein
MQVFMTKKVKITMIDWLLRWISPHICEDCGEVGTTLCKRCNFDILQSKWQKCVNCGCQMTTTELAKSGNMCRNCSGTLPFQRVFIVGERTKTLKKLVGNYKYFSRRESAKAMAKLLNDILPKKLPTDLTIVPIPTIPEHIRERGFDHMKLAARQLARQRGLECCPNLLCRTDNVSQHSAGLRQRQKQAVRAFSVNPRYVMPHYILLIDDIYTTGATTTAVAKLLKKHGAKEIWLGIVARQVNRK